MSLGAYVRIFHQLNKNKLNFFGVQCLGKFLCFISITEQELHHYKTIHCFLLVDNSLQRVVCQNQDGGSRKLLDYSLDYQNEPKDWLQFTFITLYKKGSKTKCKNYHLIGLIPHFSKVYYLKQLLQSKVSTLWLTISISILIIC